MKWWFRQQLYTQITICIAIGIALGLLLGPRALVLEPVGEIFIRLLTIVPILASIWPVVDIGHTTCNVSGDLCGTTIVASRLNMIDAAVFNDGRTQDSQSTAAAAPPRPSPGDGKTKE